MIDEKLQAELRAKYNPDGSKLRNLQMNLLDILVVIDKICRDNNITYWLSSGTLLGAVRHGGFIPWDDDCDIEIMYSDRKKFIEACKRELPKNYVLQIPETDNLYFSNIIKIRDKSSNVIEYKRWNGRKHIVKYKYNGNFVDIFTEEPSCIFFVWLSKIPIRIINIALYEWKLPIIFIRLIYLLNNLFYSFLRIATNLNPFKKYYYHTYGSWFMSRRLKSELTPTNDIIFEGKIFKGPNDADAYLKRMYGDYMKLPDKLLRVPFHDESL